MKKLKDYLTKKEIVILIISLLIILLASFSYAFFVFSDLRDEDVVTTECFKTTFEGLNDINLENAYPMSDLEGSRLTPYTFTIKNLCNKAGEYQVNVETKEESSLSTSYLRYKLNSYSSDILGQQLEVQEYVNDNISESRNIEAGVILPNEEITYNLRLWIDESSTVSQSANKLYKGKVVIKTIENKEPYQTITLNANGGTLTHNEAVKVKQRKLGNIEEPERDGYYFEDWFSDSSLTNRVDENTVVTADLDNLYAKWVAREDTAYRVEHYQMNTSGSYPSTPYEIDNLTGTTAAIVTPAVKSYTGFSAPSTQTVDIDGDGSLVVKYYYTRNKYTITFNANNGSVSPTSTTDYYGKTITLPTPTRTGYTASGWFNATSGGTKYANAAASYTINSSLTMYAQWTANKYTVTFDPNGGITPTKTKQVTYDSSYGTLPTPTRTGYTFNGWRNTIYGNNNLLSSYKWVKNQNVTVTKASNYTQVIYNQTNSTPGYICMDANEKFTVGKTYTLTASIKGIGLNSVDVLVFGTIVRLSNISTTSFTRITKTFTFNPTNYEKYYILIYNSPPTSGTGFQIQYLQIEEGDTTSGYYNVASGTVNKIAKNHTLTAEWTPNSSLFNILSTGWTSNQNVTVTKYDYGVYIVYKQNTSTPGYIYQGSNTLFTIGKKYKVTAFVRPVNTTRLSFLVHGNGVNFTGLSNTYTKLSKTFTFSGNTQNFSLIYESGPTIDTGVYIYWFDIEDSE